MKNRQVSEIFRRIAQILQIKNENIFRIRAYERAADTIDGLSKDITEYVKENKLTQLPNIGSDLAAKITEIVNTGSLKFYEELKETIPESLLTLLDIPGIGPRTAALLYERLNIKNIDDLERAIREKKLEGLEGIKEKTIQNIREGIAFLKRGIERMPYAYALEIAEDFINRLRLSNKVQQVSVAGSLRRCKETVRDIDILVISERPQEVMDIFIGSSQTEEVLAQGATKSSVRTKQGIQVDCRVVEKKSFGACLLYFTGSKDFNIRLRLLAKEKGWKINEYGVFDQDDRFLAGKTEEEIFKLFKMQFIPPELRENTGEIELAQKHKLPQLISEKDIKGDLHCHSNYSDGANSILELAQAAKERGYSYLAIVDHSQTLKVAGGLSQQRLLEKRKEIDTVNRKVKGITILFAAEVDIDNEGNLDYPMHVLKTFDLVIAAIHMGLKQPKETITKRIIRACENKYVHIIAHPTGRLWGTRDAYELDWEAVFTACRQTNTALEINSFPDRLDLNDTNCRLAKQAKVKLAINTDAHSIEHLKWISLGISVARRGWIQPLDVLNTLSLEDFLRRIKK
ncbi:MAG: DNA polymerase/3'-5' exonuclease PolX [Candidatus Omnitrophica bacterium]|nr:DNA polymerase/3'-5' exonuclease PolX [Candidatus Omnitrophota bacterium]